MATVDPQGSIHRAIWAIALPSMLTNIATALFGLADMWVIGRLGDAAPQAGVEIGAKFMMALLIVFNFLRAGTTALTAQAAGRADAKAQAATLTRALGLAAAISLFILLLMPLAVPAGMELLQASGAVAEEARTYVAIRYWGAPLWLFNIALIGWLIGRRKVRAILLIEIAANILHVGLDLLFVLRFGWGVEGVAAATILSELARTAALVVVAAREPPAAALLLVVRRRATWARAPLAALFRINRDLFLRTLLLICATLLLTRDGAREGAVVLAANGILFQFFMLSALMLDGFESAAQVLCGEALGAGARKRFKRVAAASLLWGFALAALISAVFVLFGDAAVASFTTSPDVRAAAVAYVPWIMLIPIAGVASYVLDGIYIGATWTRALLTTMVFAFAAFAVLLVVTEPLGNHGLWLAFTLFLVARAAAQTALLPRLLRRAFP